MSGNPTYQELRLLSFRLSDALLYLSVKHPAYFIVGVIVLIASAWLAWAIMRDNRLRNGFDKIQTGTTEKEVLQELGQPRRVEKCGEYFGPLPKEEADGCIREYFYASPFAPLEPQYYVVRFDANNRVRSATPYSSP
jgi:hypothetical protein